ncbi:hypothetical protein BOTBODRAFT_145951 [Botryobasidium botryosum FD-172 SS1]|uniref:RlpA-like protein double-psi beta-barrel domain-containing protein n=1 Tax=Botryobasidium botryosum (strain FD-172 SS1) TaxID=930990 RepID=A0A067MDD1_BOTB1|nr:hypothetical protein BOTBODRAFT_145951 [Botryobasidium botryosum FD-172 SS1]
MSFKNILALITLFIFASLGAAQIVGNVTLSQYTTYPETIACGWSCPISGQWASVPQDIFDNYGCNVIVRLTYQISPTYPTDVVPICDVCTSCTDAYWEAPPVVFGELGYGTASSLYPVEYDI